MLGGVVIVTDSLVDEQPVALQLTLNGQQFSSSGASFAYGLPAKVSSFCPTSGPIDGSTSVRVFGSHFSDGFVYRCRFGGGTVNASFLSDRELACVSSAQVSEGTPVTGDLG